jgi:hypothetical protein
MHFPMLDNFVDTGVSLDSVGRLADQHTPKVFAPVIGGFFVKTGCHLL